MSESEVSQIRDEDVLRRMWQQTEDFSRKKEIRAHMYRLREERLRNLYSPEPAPDGKGCEFSSAQGHVKSFADQTFQSMKSKEVRDAGSPPKEFAYRGQELKDLSNAGWNVESEDRTTDDGRTHVKSVNANIEGQYDVEGGRGQFAALDRQRRAVTEHHDASSSLRRHELASASAARDHVVRHTDDGSCVSTTTSSSNTSSKIQQVSSTKHEAVPYVTDDDDDQARRNARDPNRHEKVTRTTNKYDDDTNRYEKVTRTTNRQDYDQTLRRNDFADSELVSRKVEYPDDNTKVIVETRCMPDGTRVTSTRREFRAPPVQSTRSEHQSRSETRSYSSHHKSDSRDSTSKISRHRIDDHTNDIVDSQRNVDDYDFKRQLREYSVRDNNDIEDSQQHYVTKSDRKVADYIHTDDNFSQKQYETKVKKEVIDYVSTKSDDQTKIRQLVTDRQSDNVKDETNRYRTPTSPDHDFQQKIVNETSNINDNEKRLHNVAVERKDTEAKVSHISRHRLNIEEKVHNTTGDKYVTVEKVTNASKGRTVPLDKSHEEIVPSDRIRDISKDRAVFDENVRESTSNRTLLVNNASNIPDNGSTPGVKINNTPKDSKVPVDKFRDTPKKETTPSQKEYDIQKERTITDEKFHNITRDTKVEEVVERKTSSDHYQTTYQNDFQSRKISTDWSPTHQAWASTLRADTPPATRPSTRASSPGSRTFKSSTSSLRSSVSPDKTSKKPTSRGTSPNKVDRYSPTRTVSSDRYSSTHSTTERSLNEVRSNKNTSPERKPPTGRSPTRSGYSPDHKQQDIQRQRHSLSPEKKPPQSTDRPGSSPERTPYEKSTNTDKQPRNISPSGKKVSLKSTAGPRQSPERKPMQTSDEIISKEHPRTSPSRSTVTPDKKPIDGHPNRPLAKPKNSPSPDRKSGIQKNNLPISPEHPSEKVPKRSEKSPDRKQSLQTSRQSPDKHDDKYPRESLTKGPSVSPDRKPSYMRPTVASQSDDMTKKLPKPTDELNRPPLSKQVSDEIINGKHQDSYKSSKVNDDHYRFIDAETKEYTRSDIKDIHKKVSKISTPNGSLARDKSPSPLVKVPDKDSPDFCDVNKGKPKSPPKDTFTDYETDNHIDKTEIVTKHDRQTKDTLNIKRSLKNEDSLEGGDVPSHEIPVKYGTFEKIKLGDNTKTTELTTVELEEVNYDSRTLSDKKTPTNVPGASSSPTKKSPRVSTSPVSRPSTKDSKFKETTDFLLTEKTNEETNKKITTEGRPRQLVTPSSSPTRKQKTIETEPSTGQSSPTTSVSGFVYFGSPPAETHLITDLDDFYPERPEETSRRPETLDITRSSSPSKIPCRSPSPEKHVSTIKENLPRKSSLKKPSTGVNQASPIEKPPTSFRVSPTDDKPNPVSHKIIKKGSSSEPENSELETINSAYTVKPKPPLQRRETYEDRCKKILGMIDDTTTESVKETRKNTKKTNSGQSSLSVSPCDSPAPKESSPFPDYTSSEKTTTTKIDVTDFITHEKEDVSNNTITRDYKKVKSTSREQSPTKLKNTVKNPEESKIIRPSLSPERKSISPISSKSQPSDNLQSKPKIEEKSGNEYQKAKSPPRTSSEKEMSYTKAISVTKYDDILTGDLMTKTTVATDNKDKSKPTKKCLTEKIVDSDLNSSERPILPKTTSPSKSKAEESGPDYRRVSKPTLTDTVNLEDIQRESPEKSTNDVKSTTTTISKYDATYETKTTNVVNTKSASKNIKSPTRQPLQDFLKAGSPTITSSSLKRPDLSPQRQLPKKESAIKSTDEVPTDSVSNKQHKLPSYMKSTPAKILDTTLVSENVPDITTRKNSHPKSSPERRTPSPTKLSRNSNISPERKSSKAQQPLSPTKESPINIFEIPKVKSPTIADSPAEKTPGYMKTTASVTSKIDTSEDKTKKVFHEKTTTTKTEIQFSESRKSKSPIRHPTKHNEETEPEYYQMISPPEPSVTSFEDSRSLDFSQQRKSVDQSVPENDCKGNSPDKHPKDLASIQSLSKNRDRSRAYSPSKLSEISKIPSTSPQNLSPISPIKTDSLPEKKRPQDIAPVGSERQRTPKSTERLSPDRNPKENLGYQSITNEPRRLRTPSPTKKTSIVIETSTDFIMTEREQEILNKVQKSLKNLSPDRKEKSPSREKSPSKSTTSLQDLDITSKIQNAKLEYKDSSEITKEQITRTSVVSHSEQQTEDKSSEPQVSNKPSSRNASPTKRTPSIPMSTKMDKSSESPTKSRSISPKKPVSHVERPQSPQIPRASRIKPREQNRPHLIRKPTPATLSPTKVDRLTTEVRKTNTSIKQNILTKTTASKTINRSIPTLTNKNSEIEFKRSSTPKGTKENVSPKKEIVTRTTSDTAIKPKKTSSPQRMKSKPEIQVIDLSTKSPKSLKPIIKEPHSKMPSKPKSATALNTSTDEDDIIIDVQQSKSSRENSPDRICPTPVNFSDDTGIPRFPDEVSEPDDELLKRTYHTIHETESVVDDIVEICEEEELFMKKSNMDSITEQDDSLLSVNDKVSKFTKNIYSGAKPRETVTTAKIKETEKRDHLEYVDESLKSDECLLTVSEKVNKFAKGPRDTKDSRSPSRKITDEYDKVTDYTDDYTKLSVNDKAHLFVETAENVKVTKIKPAQKVVRPDLSQIDESLKSDDCLLSVSDKVSKFVKTAEQYMTETHGAEETENKIKEQHEKIMRQIVDDDDYVETFETKDTVYKDNIDKSDRQDKPKGRPLNESNPHTNESKTSKLKDYTNPKPGDRIPAVKITTLRSSEAVKKAKALFENIASTQKTTHKDSTLSVKTTKLTDIGVIKKSPKTDSTTVLHPSVEDVFPQVTDEGTEVAPLSTKDQTASGTPTISHRAVRDDEKPRSSPDRLRAFSPEGPKSKSPMRHSVQTTTTTKTVLSRYPGVTRAESPRHRPESPKQRPQSPRRTESPKLRPESDRLDKVPGYLRPTKTSQIKEEIKTVEDAEVSSRRGSGKFGVELRRTSVERSTVSSERRRSFDHHQPCIEDIFDLDLLEQMLEKVVGYEQRRRIRAQIRIAKNQSEHIVDTNTYTRTTKQTSTTSKTRSPERKIASPERAPKSTPQKTSSPDHHNKSSPNKIMPDRSQPKEPTLNGHVKEHSRTINVARQRPHSPEKSAPKSTLAPKTPTRQPSPDKRRTASPTKVTSKPKGNRFNEYASAYMKKVGLNEIDKVKFTDNKTKKIIEAKQTVNHEKQQETVQQFTTTKSFTERTSSKDVIELIQTNGKRSPSPQQRQSPERKVQFPDRKVQGPERKPQSPERKVLSPVRKDRSPERRVYSPEQKAQSPERLHQRTPSPDFKRPKSVTGKETNIKTVYDLEKKVPKTLQEEKPSWVTNRNLKKITTETRTYSSKKIENEKPKYRASSPSKVISKPIDVITSSYGPGPLDADGKPLFGIKALRNGASNFQVKGTVIRSEFHSRNGGEPQGSVSVTAYSSQPEELQQLLEAQGEPPSRIHGLAAITTTKTFGGDTGNSLATVHTKEDRASLEQFTHHDRRVEHLERMYDSTQEFSEDTCTEFSTNRRIEPRNDRYTNKSDRQPDNNERLTDRSTRRDKATEEKRTQKVEERKEKMDKREDKKTVRQSSVKSLTEKYIKSANDSGKGDRSTYPKAGLILRTTTAMRDSVSSDDAHPGLVRTDSEHSLGSAEDTVVTSTERVTGGGLRTTTTRSHHGPTRTTTKTSTLVTQEPVITHRVVTERGGGRTETVTERSFLDSSTKVTGVQDILTRMKNADIVVQEGDSTEDAEARALLNKFLGATVLMAGMQGYVHPHGDSVPLQQETVRSSGTGGKVTIRSVEELDLDQCWDERLLRNLLEECTDYEQRRRLRARLRTLMAEQEACASAVTEALGAGHGEGGEGGAGDAREEEEVTVTSSVRRDSSDKTVSSTTTTKTTKVIEMTRPAPKPVSPFAKFRQLEKQNSTNSPNSPKTPQSPGSPSQPYFKFTDPALQSSALTIKERLLQWCRDKTRDYENVKLENFSTSWADGLAFCALVHHFLPNAFDYSKLTPDRRRHNFTLAFKVADEKAGIYPLLDVDDMVAMRKPDWKCVFTYVQAIYRRFKDEQ